MNGPSRPRRLALMAALALGVVMVGWAMLRISRPSVGTDDAPRPYAAEEQAPPGQPGKPGTGPDGFSHDEVGAAQAAVAYAGASQRWLYMTDEEIAAAIYEIATPEGAVQLTDQVLEDVRTARGGLLESPGRVWWIVHPLAWRIDYFAPDRATVSVWTMTLISAADVALPQTEWLTATLDLRWMDGDWHLDSASQVFGPTPMTGPHDEPWQPEPFDDALAGFTRLDGEPVDPPEGL